MTLTFDRAGAAAALTLIAANVFAAAPAAGSGDLAFLRPSKSSVLRGMRAMSKPRFFSGPPANKATAAALAAAVVTMFWTIAAHTFWKTMNIADMTLYIATSTVFLTAIVAFAIPESGAYSEYNTQRIAMQLAAEAEAAVTGPAQSANRALKDQLLRIQELEAVNQVPV